jgi:CRP-like cAMP-binding protein
MITLEKMFFLKSMPLFKSTKDDVLLIVASATQEQFVERGTIIIQKGEWGDTMHMIVKGRIKIHDGDFELKQIGERDLFGELAALVPDQRNATVSAIEDTLLLTIKHSSLFELMEINFGLVKGIINVLVNRLRETDIYRK